MTKVIYVSPYMLQKLSPPCRGKNKVNALCSWNGHCICTVLSELRKTLWFLVNAILLLSFDKMHVSNVSRMFLRALLSEIWRTMKMLGLQRYTTVKSCRKIK